MSKIIIEHTKRIKYLEFSLPKKNGVYLLVAPNGHGKSTLLTTLHRICYSNSFADKFKTSSKEAGIDDYKTSKIRYIDNEGNTITFRKKEQRWVSSPRNNKIVLEKFGYEESLFIEADPKRIAVKGDEIKAGKREKVNDEICRMMVDWFEEPIFAQLFKMRNSHSRGRGGVWFYVVREAKNHLYSEKRFSTGELAVIRLLDEIERIKGNSLLLIDEAELALHPRVQLKLLEYLRKISEEKSLTVFIATHSISMIENTNPNNIYIIEKADASHNYTVETPCYPARALGNIIGREYGSYNDALIFVEDEMARLVLEKLIDYYKDKENSGRVNHIRYRIYPVGGYEQTAELAHQVWGSCSFRYKFIRAVVDHDVYEKTGDQRKYIRQEFIDKHRDIICDLGCIPEYDLIKLVEEKEGEYLKMIDNKYNIDAHCIINKEKAGDDKKRKHKFDTLVKEIMKMTGRNEEVVKHELIETSIPFLYPDAKMKETIGRIYANQEKHD